MKSIFVFLDITKVADSQGKNTDASRTQEDVRREFFGSSLS